MTPAILLFVKWPEPGRVKTRIAVTAGAERAAEIYRELTAAVCARLPRDEKVIVMFDPPVERARVEEWLRPLLGERASFSPQASGDLGERLTRAFAEAFETGHGPVSAIGSDCIDLEPGLFRSVRDELKRADCAIGPSTDGGYYLIALAAPQASLFHDITWSAPETLARTLERAREAGLRVHLLPEQSDVDTESDWKAVEPRIAKAASNA